MVPLVHTAQFRQLVLFKNDLAIGGHRPHFFRIAYLSSRQSERY